MYLENMSQTQESLYRLTIEEDSAQFFFECIAESPENAQEQALNSYPMATVTKVELA